MWWKSAEPFNQVLQDWLQSTQGLVRSKTLYTAAGWDFLP